MSRGTDAWIANQMEPDHSGWISSFRKIKDDFTVICTEKAASFLYAQGMLSEMFNRWIERIV